MFSQATITDGPLFSREGADVLVSWTCSDPDGTHFQLYKDRRLIWNGTARRVVVPYHAEQAVYEVGTVDGSEAHTDLSGSLPALPSDGNRAVLSWSGGTFLGDSIAGFRIYGEPTPGAGIDYATVLGDVPAYTAGVITDGAGMGGAGLGGAGAAAASYSWTSPPLGPGTWHYGIKPYDDAGNEGTAATTSVAIAGPPNPPAPFADGTRLHHSFDPGTGVVTLAWNASP